jgi:hypothetical protein
MNAEERDFVKTCVDGGIARIETRLDGIEKLFDEKNLSVCKRLENVEKDFTQHDKRIVKLEVSVGKLATKIALFSTIGGLVASIVASIFWGV